MEYNRLAVLGWLRRANSRRAETCEYQRKLNDAEYS